LQNFQDLFLDILITILNSLLQIRHKKSFNILLFDFIRLFTLKLAEKDFASCVDFCSRCLIFFYWFKHIYFRGKKAKFTSLRKPDLNVDKKLAYLKESLTENWDEYMSCVKKGALTIHPHIGWTNIFYLRKTVKDAVMLSFYFQKL